MLTRSRSRHGNGHSGKPVLGLPPEAFHIFENGQEQPVTRDAGGNTASIGLVFDASASMQGKLDARARDLSC